MNNSEKSIRNHGTSAREKSSRGAVGNLRNIVGTGGFTNTRNQQGPSAPNSGEAKTATSPAASSLGQPSTPDPYKECPGGLKECRAQIVRLLGQISAFHNDFQDAFGHRVFLPDLAPTDPRNKRRANAYLGHLARVTGLLLAALELWRLAWGVELEGDGKKKKRTGNSALEW